MAAVEGTEQKIILPLNHGFISVALKDIVRLESDSNYTNMYLSNGKKEVVPKTMQEFDKILKGNGFFRVHRSDIVNLSFIKKYQKGPGGHITMMDGAIVEVARGKKDEFLGLFYNNNNLHL